MESGTSQLDLGQLRAGLSGLHEAQALSRLYFRQGAEYAQKRPQEREKRDYLDLAHTLSDVRPEGISQARYNQTDRKSGSTYTSGCSAGIKLIYTGREPALYTLPVKPEMALYRRKDGNGEEDWYIN